MNREVGEDFFHPPKLQTYSAWENRSHSFCLTLLISFSMHNLKGRGVRFKPQTGTSHCHISQREGRIRRDQAKVGDGWLVGFWRIVRDRRKLTRVGCGGRVGLTVLDGGGHCMRGSHGCLSCVQVGLLLELADVFFVTDPLVAEPVGYLRERQKE